MQSDIDLKTRLKIMAIEAGFLDCGVAPAALPASHSHDLKEWLREGMHGEMEYMARHAESRSLGADHVLPGARSVIVFAAAYQDGRHEASRVPAESSRPMLRVAGYATGEDYHYVLRKKLQEIVSWLDQERPNQEWRVCVDSAPLMERAYAVAAGLGFIGRNSMLISWMRGSYTLLAEIVTTAEIMADSPKTGTCGQCTRCIEACPTNAIVAPGRVDARRCISYLTIEKKSELTPVEASKTGEWAFGCDICQDVCPYNKAPASIVIQELGRSVVDAKIDPEIILQPDSNSQFERRFEKSPLLRPGRRRLQRLVRLKMERCIADKGKSAKAAEKGDF